MPRVLEEEVNEIFDNPNSKDVQPFINTATRVVDRHLVGKGMSDDELHDVEMWLSAHFLAMLLPRISRAAMGKSSVTFEGKTEMHLDHTRYGQTAKLLDWTNTLTQLGKARAKFSVVSRKELP